MATLTLPSRVGVGMKLSAEIGRIPLITFGNSTADRVRVHVYAAGWGRSVEVIDDVTAPFEIDFNNRSALEPGKKYEIEFRPFREGKYLGGDRQFFTLALAGQVGNAPSGSTRLLLGVVDATKTMHAQTPCHSTLWNGPKPWLSVLADCGVRWIREWWSISASTADWTKWDRVRPFVGAGMQLVICLHWAGPAMPAPETVAASVRRAVARVPSDLRHAIKFEVGNEPGRGDYWVGNNIGQYVRRFLNPAYDVLHNAGYVVILGGLNGNFADDFRQVMAAGGKFDLVGIHPYAVDEASFKTKYAALLALTDKDIWETESRAYIGQAYKAGSKTAAEVIALDNAQLAARGRMPQVKAIAVFSPDVRDSATGPLGLFRVETKNNVPIKATATTFFDQWFARLSERLAV